MVKAQVRMRRRVEAMCVLVLVLVCVCVCVCVCLGERETGRVNVCTYVSERMQVRFREQARVCV